ncbi:MAG: class I SAM-dependent methyltransferase [Desulfobulbaceae bacterium]|nr:class I SAM-dependent methyltransferase [Desulfobulbaceae bacterium]
MRSKKQWDDRYEQDDLPWDTGHPDTYLVRMVSRWPKLAGKVLEVGCGTGTNAIWLAEQGLEVTGLDISSSAIALAQDRAAVKGVECRFLADDFYNCPLDNEFAFVFDRGCFHSTADAEGRTQFVDRVASCLISGGIWLSLMGNSDEIVEKGKGPPRLSAMEIAASVEPAFEILRLESCLLESRSPQPPRFWQCLMRVR